MIEFQTLCFLQNHKTGCSFVEAFLRRHCSEDLVRYEKHRALPSRRPGKFHFVGLREPLDTYLSLFNFGLDGKGEIFLRLRASGRGDLYAVGLGGFTEWLRHLLDPAFAAGLYPPGTEHLAERCGLLTTRFLRLAIPGWQEDPSGEWRERLAGPDAVDEVLRHETLLPQLKTLITGKLAGAIADAQAALQWLDAAPRINASARRDTGTRQRLPADLCALLADRERLIYDAFYPEERPDAGRSQ